MLAVVYYFSNLCFRRLTLNNSVQTQLFVKAQTTEQVKVLVQRGLQGLLVFTAPSSVRPFHSLGPFLAPVNTAESQPYIR